MPRAELTLFAHIASRPEAEIDLAQTALLIAEDEYPGLDVAAYIERIDGYGAAARERPARASTSRATAARRRASSARSTSSTASSASPATPATITIRGTRGSTTSSIARSASRSRSPSCSSRSSRAPASRRPACRSPATSWCARRGRRGPALRRSFRRPESSRARGCASSTAASPASRAIPIRACSSPPDKKQVLVRMLHNLRGIFAARGDRNRLRGVLERLEILTPSDELRREIISLGGESPLPPAKQRILN